MSEEETLDLSVCGSQIRRENEQQEQHRGRNTSAGGAQDDGAMLQEEGQKIETAKKPTMPTNFVEADSWLQHECDKLGVGETCLAPSFYLRNAMQAMEVMNPKMDSGVLRRQTIPVDERVKSGQFKVVPEAKELPKIFDKLARLEVCALFFSFC